MISQSVTSTGSVRGSRRNLHRAAALLPQAEAKLRKQEQCLRATCYKKTQEVMDLFHEKKKAISNSFHSLPPAKKSILE